MGQGGCLLVGLAGLEPATFRPPDGRATRLRHSPYMRPYINPGDGSKPIMCSNFTYALIFACKARNLSTRSGDARSAARLARLSARRA